MPKAKRKTDRTVEANESGRNERPRRRDTSMKKRRTKERKLMDVVADFTNGNRVITLAVQIVSLDDGKDHCHRITHASMTAIKDQRDKLRKRVIKRIQMARAAELLTLHTSMENQEISDRKLIDIALNITKANRVTKLVVQLGLNSDDVNNAGRYWCNIKCNNMNDIEDQRDRLGDGLFPSVHMDAAAERLTLPGLQDRTLPPAYPSLRELDPEMQYVMWESLVKGYALVIGNADFPKKGELPASPRSWAEMDINNMNNLLEDLGYDFRNIYRDLSKSGMEEAVQAFTEQLEKDKPQSAVVYISSHGDDKGIEGSDRRKLPIQDLLKKFSGVLLGKPKVLIVDACWGDGETSRLPVSVSNCSSGAQTKTCFPENADIFLIHSTSYGKKAWSNTDKGSWFVQVLRDVVYNNEGHLEDLDAMMSRVTRELHKRTAYDDTETSHGTQSTTLVKQGVYRKLFFYPGFEISQSAPRVSLARRMQTVTSNELTHYSYEVTVKRH